MPWKKRSATTELFNSCIQWLRGCRISGQNSLTTCVPASAPNIIPPVAKPLPTVRNRAGCQAREINPLPKFPEIRPIAGVRFPVVVLRVTTVLTNAYFILGPKPRLPEGR